MMKQRDTYGANFSKKMQEPQFVDSCSKCKKFQPSQEDRTVQYSGLISRLHAYCEATMF